MTPDSKPTSNLQRYVWILIAVILTIYALIKARILLIPVVFAGLLFITMLPVYKRWLRIIKSDVLSAVATILTVLIPLVGILMFFSIQIVEVGKNLPAIGENMQQGLENVLTWIGELPLMRNVDLDTWLQENLSSLVTKPLGLVQAGISQSTTTLTGLFLTLITFVFFLFYERGIKRWILLLAPDDVEANWIEAIKEIQTLVQRYLVGMVTVILILAVMNSIGLWAIGIEYALLWGFLAGFLALIPYIGTLIGGLLPFLYSVATTETWYQPLLVVGLFVVVQFIEGNLITPKVVGEQVSINPLAAIFALLIGASIWGLAGIVLAIPLVAIIRVICSRVDGLEPVAFILGTSLSSPD
ncbi:MAG: AI-2E family transporter [Saprospiraceae bacterium]|nr:AI-2E family transporter [Saprospiraceae bacterium]